MNKFQERLTLRIVELEEIQESDMMKLEVKVPELYPIQKLDEYWHDYVCDRVVDRVKDDDRELNELQKVWIQDFVTSPTKSRQSKTTPK